jgi:hypothetical protein
MKNAYLPPFAIPFLTASLLLLPGISLAIPTNSLPSTAAFPMDSATQRGLIVRTVQAPASVPVPNSFLRAIHQLNGTLVDSQGHAVTNEALPGSNPDRSHPVDTINFEVDARPIEVLDPVDGDTVLATFAPANFPGIPGTGGHSNYFAAEVRTFLELSAGVHWFGVSVSIDRTDANDDDGYQVFAGTRCRDFFATPVAEFARAGEAFEPNQHIENQWAISVPVDGIYPFRLVYWQTQHGGNLQWYSILPETGERILVNDSADSRAIKAYRECRAAGANLPFVGEVAPLPGASANLTVPPVEVLMFDGLAAIDTNMIRLLLNNIQVSPSLSSRNQGEYLVQIQPTLAQMLVTNYVRVEYADVNGESYTNEWPFTFQTSVDTTHPVAGQWNFLAGDIYATVGRDLEYFDPDGSGLTQSKTRFGTTTELGVPDIKDQPTKIMEVPGDLDRRIGYVMYHGIPPNGGGTRVNQFTLIMDILVHTEGAFSASLINMSETNNTTDGDLFWQQGDFGQGSDGYYGQHQFTDGEWHRICAAYDEAANPPVVTKFVDGIKQDDWTANQGFDNPRRTLLPSAILFGDGDADERRMMWVSSIQIRVGKLSDAEMEALGGPAANKIPLLIPGSSLPEQPKLQGRIQNGAFILTWPATTVEYVLESTPVVTHPVWVTVSGVSNNSAIVPLTPTNQFFRLRH